MPGIAASSRRDRAVGGEHVHGSAETGAGDRLCMFCRNAYLGSARQLVEPSVERLHPEERNREDEHHAGARDEAGDRAPHHALRPAAPERVAALLGRPPRQRDAQPVDTRSHRGEQCRQERDRRQHRDANDHDRADGHRAQRVDVDCEERSEGNSHRSATEDDRGARARHCSLECLLRIRSFVQLTTEAAHDEERVVDCDADPDHRCHVRDVDRDLERPRERVDHRAAQEHRGEPECQRCGGGHKRSEPGEEDQQDEREPERLAARKLLLRDVLEVRPDRRLADHTRLSACRGLHERTAQVRRFVDRVGALADEREREEDRTASNKRARRANLRLRPDDALHRRDTRAGAGTGDEHRERRRDCVGPLGPERVRDLE